MGETVTVVQRRVTVGDPHVVTDDADVLAIRACLYEPLVRRNEALGFDPCLATSWRVSNDATTWWLTLRQEALFHDGERLDADDVIASLERIKAGGVEGELGTTGAYAWYLAGSTFERLSPHDVKVSLAEPMADLLDLLVDIPIVSRRSLEGAPGQLAGTGAYVLDDVDGDRLALSRRRTYWRETSGPSRVVWHGCPSPRDRLERLLDGAADIACDLQRVDGRELETSRGLRLHRVRTPACTVFMLNLRHGPCASPSFRKLLSAAIDKERVIADVLGGAAVPISGPLTDLHLGFVPDPDTGGGGDGGDEPPNKVLDDVAPRITLNVPATTPDEAPKLARRLAASFATVGIRTDVVVHEDREAYAALVKAGEIGDGACFDSTPLSTFRVLNEKFHSKRGGPWWQGYSEPSVDAALDAARATTDLGERRRLYQRAYRKISEDVPWLFLYSPLRYMGTTSQRPAPNVTPEGHLDVAVPG